MSLESTMYTVNQRLEELTDAMKQRVAAESDGGDVEAALEHETQAAARATAAVQQRIASRDPAHCKSCLCRSMRQWKCRATACKERWEAWCAATVPDVENIPPCAHVGRRRHSAAGVMDTLVNTTLAAYDTVVGELHVRDISRVSTLLRLDDAEYVHKKMHRAKCALDAAIASPDLKQRAHLRAKLRALLHDHAHWMADNREFLASSYRNTGTLDCVLTLIFSPRKRTSPDSPVAERHQSARAKRVKAR